MKKELDRIKRLTSVLEKMHDIQNVRLVAAQQDLAMHKERESALLDALLTCPANGHPFMKSLGRSLSAAAENTKAASDKAEQLKASSVSAMAKHTTLFRRAEHKQAEWYAFQERSELNRVIDVFGNASVSQANSVSLVVAIPQRHIEIAASDTSGYEEDEEKK